MDRVCTRNLAARGRAALFWLVACSLVVGLASPGANEAIGRPLPDAARCKHGEPVQIVAFGDSLTAGFGLPQSASFPVQLEKALRARGQTAVVANAGVSGDTTSGGLKRFDWAVPKNTDAVILELGANDALRGLPPQAAKRNLDKIIARLRERRIAVLVAGMRALRNWGNDYQLQFDGIFSDLATKHGTLLYPFFLDGVALERELNLEDGLHPNAKGIDEIVKRILPKVEKLIARAQSICAEAAKAKSNSN